MATDFQDKSDVHYKLGAEQSPMRSEDEDLDSDLDVCLLDDGSPNTKKNMADMPDEDLSDDLLHSDEEEQTMSNHGTVDGSQVTSCPKPPHKAQERISGETTKQSPLLLEKGTGLEPQDRCTYGQGGKRSSGSTADATAAEEPGEHAGDQESEDEAVNVEINEPFDDEFQKIIEEEEESNEEEDDEQPCHSRFKSERKEGMVVVRLSDGAHHRRNIPDTLELSEVAKGYLNANRAGAKYPATRPTASEGAGGRGGARDRKPFFSYLALNRMEVGGNVRGFEARPVRPPQRPSVQPPLPSYQWHRPPQQRCLSQPKSFSQPSQQGRPAPAGPAVPLMSAQSQAKPAVAPQCLSGATAAGPPHFPQPPRSQHAESCRGQAPPKERSGSEPQVPGQHMLDQWRCPRPLDCNPRFPSQALRRPPPPPKPRPEPGPRLGPGPGLGREPGMKAGAGQPPSAHREPTSPLPPPPPPPSPHSKTLSPGQHVSRPLLLQGQRSPWSSTPTKVQPPATSCVLTQPASSKVSLCSTAPNTFAEVPQTQTQSQSRSHSQPRPRFPGFSGTGPPVPLCQDAARPSPAPAMQVRPFTRAEQSAKPVLVARGAPATAVPAQRAKAEPAASAAPQPGAPARNAGQKVKEEPPSPALGVQGLPAKACVKAEEEEDEEMRVYMEKMEEQKRKRLEVLRQKELRRQLQAEEVRRALWEHSQGQTQNQEDPRLWPRELEQPWGQGGGAPPYQHRQREFPSPPCHFDKAKDASVQVSGHMGPVPFKEVQQEKVFPRGSASFQQSQEGPPQGWTNPQQGPGVQTPQQQSQQRQALGMQVHVKQEDQPYAELVLGNAASDVDPGNVHGLDGSPHRPQSQVIHAPRFVRERLGPVEPTPDGFSSGPWPSPAPAGQSWFRPRKICGLSEAWRPQRVWQPWEKSEEQGPAEPLRATFKRTLAHRGDGHYEGQPPLKVIQGDGDYEVTVHADEEHSEPHFTRNVAMKHEDTPNVTRLITMGTILQPPSAQLQNMVSSPQHRDEGAGTVCPTQEHTGLWTQYKNSLPSSNLIVKINY